MKEDYEAGLFASDDLLARAQADLDAFYWQSHTMTHLARDNLGKNDCDIEDGGKCTATRSGVGVRVAVERCVLQFRALMSQERR